MNVEFKDNSDEVLDALEEAVERALVKCGLTAERYAKKLTPVGTPESTGVPGYVGGLLRNSITHAISGQMPAIKTYTDNKGERTGSYSEEAPKGTDKEMTVYIGTNVEYAPYVECGTGRHTAGGRPDAWGYIDDEGRAHHTGGNKAKPFLKPAVADHVQTYRKIIEGELKGKP